MKSKKLNLIFTVLMVLVFTMASVSMILVYSNNKGKENSPPENTTSKTNQTESQNTPETEKPLKNKKVAFTFDDGPHETRTIKFIDELHKYNGAATFFVVGNRIDINTGKVLKYALDNGWDIGIHGYTHKVFFDNCTNDSYNSELSKTAKEIKKYTNSDTFLLRPPGGRISESRLSACPYSIILWDVDSEDWKNKSENEAEKQKNIDKIVENVLSNVSDGDIVLMHDIYENSYEAFCIIVAELDNQGYEFVSVSELLGNNMQSGKIYYKAEKANG